jgi:hypothetical protein
LLCGFLQDKIGLEILASVNESCHIVTGSPDSSMQWLIRDFFLSAEDFITLSLGIDKDV